MLAHAHIWIRIDVVAETNLSGKDIRTGMFVTF